MTVQIWSLIEDDRLLHLLDALAGHADPHEVCLFGFNYPLEIQQSCCHVCQPLFLTLLTLYQDRLIKFLLFQGWYPGKKPMFGMFSLDIFIRLVPRIIITGGVREISDLLCKVIVRGWSSY
jgi:hypothetical protein